LYVGDLTGIRFGCTLFDGISGIIENFGCLPFDQKFRFEISGIPYDEWNRIFRLLLFSGILGQAREVHLKFRNEIPENVLSIRSSPGISGIFGRTESALCVPFARDVGFSLLSERALSWTSEKAIMAAGRRSYDTVPCLPRSKGTAVFVYLAKLRAAQINC